jgi:hypothetical protein
MAAIKDHIDWLKQAVWDSLILQRTPQVAAADNLIHEDALHMALTAFHIDKIQPDWEMPDLIEQDLPTLIEQYSELSPILHPSILHIDGFTLQLPQLASAPESYFNGAAFSPPPTPRSFDSDRAASTSNSATSTSNS